MFLSPLSEIPQLGRTWVYIITLGLFVILQVPTAFARSLGALLPLRFLAGFVGSPPLATGGASIDDMWGADDRAIVLGIWGLAAVCGPVLGPLLGGFAAQAEGWTWTIWILLWLSGGALVFLAVFLPETSSST
jgi:DHA1 family multidrug resistance protein-like MFS transporter